jgi:hypothetical protein
VPHKGIHSYSNKKDLLLDVKTYFVKEKIFPTIIFEYKKPNYGLSSKDFFEYCEKGKRCENI